MLVKSICHYFANKNPVPGGISKTLYQSLD
jgi:hypothetical protein